MKKLIVAAFSLGMVFFSATVTAGTTSKTVISVNLEDERQPVKAEELPEAVKKTLAGEEFKGYTISQASLVKTADATSYYEVSLAKDKETKIVKVDKEGKLLK